MMDSGQLHANNKDTDMPYIARLIDNTCSEEEKQKYSKKRNGEKRGKKRGREEAGGIEASLLCTYIP